MNLRRKKSAQRSLKMIEFDWSRRWYISGIPGERFFLAGKLREMRNLAAEHFAKCEREINKDKLNRCWRYLKLSPVPFFSLPLPCREISRVPKRDEAWLITPKNWDRFPFGIGLQRGSRPPAANPVHPAIHLPRRFYLLQPHFHFRTQFTQQLREIHRAYLGRRTFNEGRPGFPASGRFVTRGKTSPNQTGFQ